MASLRPYKRFVAGVYGNEPCLLASICSCQSQYDLLIFDFFATDLAFSDTALKDNPGGNIKPFCDPETVTSTPQSSCLYSIEARPDIVSTINKAL